MQASDDAVSFHSIRPHRGHTYGKSEAAAGPVNHRLALRNGGKLRRQAADLARAVSFSPGD
jgi:hypothetical protein